MQKPNGGVGKFQAKTTDGRKASTCVTHWQTSSELNGGAAATIEPVVFSYDECFSISCRVFFMVAASRCHILGVMPSVVRRCLARALTSRITKSYVSPSLNWEFVYL